MHVSVKRALWVCSIVWLASACRQNKDAEGPMERAGKNVDHAAKKTGQAVEKAAQKTGAAAERAAEATGDALRKAGKKLKGDDPPPAAQKTK
jgi:hypothetical protein